MWKPQCTNHRIYVPIDNHKPVKPLIYDFEKTEQTEVSENIEENEEPQLDEDVEPENSFFSGLNFLISILFFVVFSSFKGVISRIKSSSFMIW